MAALPLLTHHREPIQFSGHAPNLIRDLKKWSSLSATALLLGENSTDLTHALLRALPAYGRLDAREYLIVQHLIALGSLTDDAAMLAPWRNHAYALDGPDDITAPDHLPTTYELLYCTSASVMAGADSDLALACARMTHRVFLGAPFYTVAPLVLVLTGLATQRGMGLTALLANRCRLRDAEVCEATLAPRMRIVARAPS